MLDSITSDSDATHSYRGYRLQALYILWRVLNSEESLIFQPEGIEDLAVYENNGNLLEITQVKAHSDDLTLTDFKPKKSGSFFNRVYQYLQHAPSMIVNIISFGNFGASLYQGLSGSIEDKENFSELLSTYKYLTSVQALQVINAIHPIQVSEQVLQGSVEQQLSDLLVGEAQTAFDLLACWIYSCSEDRQTITRKDVIKRITNVGKIVNERAAHHREWFTSIIPVEDISIEADQKSVLESEFYRGVAARYEHILADLDLKRTRRLEEIHHAFKTNNVVIVHGISGQGKTALALRYLYDYLPKDWRFRIQSPENRTQALSIATAISQQLQSINIPLTIYLDVRPSETNWVDTVRELAFLPSIKIIVTIREDDLRRSSLSVIDFPYSTIELQLDQDEARNIYSQFVAIRQVSEFPDFETAWEKFGGTHQGPLMEFIHLITQGESLQHRLRQQVIALEDEVAAKNLDKKILTILRIVSIAAAFGARLNRKILAERLTLDVPRRLLERLEKEYLIKVDLDDFLIDGVHPIRSALIKELLLDEYSSWKEDVQLCLDCMFEPDLFAFLLEIFVKHPDKHEIMVETLDNYQPQTWTGIAGVTRSLVWLGIARFVEHNSLILDEAYILLGNAGTMLLNPDIATALPDTEASIAKLGEIEIASEAVKQAKELGSKIQNLSQLYDFANDWLNKPFMLPSSPTGTLAWQAWAETTFWVRHLQIDKPINEWFENIDFAKMIKELDLDTLADVSAAIAHKQKNFAWHEQYKSSLLARFKHETNTAYIDTNDATAQLHYFFDYEISYSLDSVSDPLHFQSLRRCRIFLDLCPSYEKVEIHGHGHRSPVIQIADTTIKSVSKLYLPRKWLVWVNSVYSGLYYWRFRPSSWKEYSNQLIDLRQASLKLMIKYERAIESYFERRNPARLYTKLVVPNRETIINRLKKLPLLPKTAVDAWGITKETAAINDAVGSIFEPKGILVHKFIPHSAATRGYFTALANFFDQSEHALIMAENQRIVSQEQRSRFFTLNAKTGAKEHIAYLSIVNLINALHRLPAFHNSFRLLLNAFVSEAALLRLDRQEQETYERLCKLWYFFVFEPYHIKKKALIPFSATFLEAFESFIQHLIGRIKSNISEKVTTNWITWENNKVLIIFIDSSDGLSLYSQLSDQLQILLKESFHVIEQGSLLYFSILFSMEQLMIVPTINRKMISDRGFYFPSTVLLSKDEIHKLHFLARPLPLEVLDQFRELDINFYTNATTELADKLSKEVGKIYALVTHLYDLTNIPEISDEDVDFVQGYINKVSRQLSTSLETIYNCAAETISMIADYSFNKPANQANAYEAVQSFWAILPKDLHKRGRFSLGDLPEIQSQFAEALNYANVLLVIMASEE